MKNTIKRTYHLLLRLQGAFTLAFVAMFWLGISSAGNTSLLMLVPILVAGFVTWLAMAFAIPALTPRFLAMPGNRMETITILVALLVSGLLFVMTIMGGIALYGVSEPMATNMAVSASVVSILMTAVLMAITFCSCIFRSALSVADTPSQDDVADVTRTLPPLEDIRNQRNQIA